MPTATSAFNQFVNSLQKKPSTTTTPFYPTPTGQPLNNPPASTAKSNFTNNFGSNISSNAGATGTTGTVIKPPTIKSPAAQTFINSQLPPKNADGSYTSTGGATIGADGKIITSAPQPTNITTGTSSTDSTPNATDTAFAAYLKSLQPSADVTNAKTAYNYFIANETKSVNGLEGQGRGIPLTLVRGQEEKLKNQSDPEATRLQNAIGIAQDDQTNTTNATKALYDYQTNKDKNATTSAGDAITNNKPFAVGDDTYAYNSTTGQYDKTGTNKTASTSAGGFSLSPGENRYDASGKLIASGGPKPLSQAQETAQIANTDKEKAAQQSASQSIGLVNNLLSGDVYKNITGVSQGPLGLPIGNLGTLGIFNQKAVNDYDQLQGLLKLGIRGLLKGQGAVSDFEGRILGQAASDLGRNLSNGDFKQALLKIRGVLQTNNGGDTNVIVKDKNGKTIGQGALTGQDIYDAVNDGNTIEYVN